MRIDGGLQGYYYDQGRFKRPDLEAEEAVAAPVQPVQRQAGFSPLVGTSTLLSSSLSSALWTLESGAGNSNTPASEAAATAANDDTADKVRALYLEYAGE